MIQILFLYACRNRIAQKACLAAVQDASKRLPAEHPTLRNSVLRVYNAIAPCAVLTRNELGFLSSHGETLSLAIANTLETPTALRIPAITPVNAGNSPQNPFRSSTEGNTHPELPERSTTKTNTYANSNSAQQRVQQARSLAWSEQQMSMEAVSSVKSLTAVVVSMLYGVVRAHQRHNALLALKPKTKDSIKQLLPQGDSTVCS